MNGICFIDMFCDLYWVNILIKVDLDRNNYIFDVRINKNNSLNSRCKVKKFMKIDYSLSSFLQTIDNPILDTFN